MSRGMKFNGNIRHFERKKPIKETLGRLLKYIASYKFYLIAVFFFIIIGALANVAGSLFLGILIDDYIVPLTMQTNPDFAPLVRALCFMAVIYACGALSNYLHNRLMVNVSQGVLKRIRNEMFAHMQKLPVRFFDTNSHGDLMSRYTNDTDTLRQMISMSIPQIFSSVITIISVFTAMITKNIYLTLFVVMFSGIMLTVSRTIAKRSSKFFIKQQKSLGAVNGYIEERVHGQKVVKVFCHEKKNKEGFDEKNKVLRENAYLANKFANIIMPINGNLGHLQYVLIAVVGGAIAINFEGVVTLGTIATFLQLSKNFSMPVNQVSQQFNSIVMALAGAERIFEVIDEPVETDDGDVTLCNAEITEGKVLPSDKYTGKWAWKVPEEDGSFSYVELKGDVSLNEVDFGYNEDKLVLKDISLYARPGQKIAFVGATGAGKTTITNLINRFYDIADGKIQYDGININRIKKDDLRHSLGVVLQNVNLFTGTVMENIRYGNLDATDEECIEAAKKANAHDFITRLPNGYNTIISGDGSEISQGQRQLISIARAAVANPPVMILDEATSSIDTRTESIVQKGMDTLMKGRTVFVIAHRLSTVINSDVIMVLDKGKIIERGSHEELLALKGVYYNLYSGMFELD